MADVSLGGFSASTSSSPHSLSLFMLGSVPFPSLAYRRKESFNFINALIMIRA